MARIPQITGKADVAPAHYDLVDRVVEVFGEVRGPFSILLHSPGLAERGLSLVKWFREGSVVTAELRVLAILAAVREHGSAYVWAAQVGYARRSGVRAELIDAIRSKSQLGGVPEPERDVILFGRQLVRDHRVEQAVFDRLRERHGDQWLVELAAAIGFYGMLASVANAFELPPLPDGDRLPAE